MKVSIIIPVYNSAATIELTLRSVFAQTYTDYEIIVVDDASSDGTADVVKKTFNRELGELGEFRKNVAAKERKEKDYKIIELEENKGPAGARNAGIAEAKGEWIAFLDGDDLWPPYRLAVQLKEAEKDPDAVLLCGFAPSFGSDAELTSSTTQSVTGGLGSSQSQSPVGTQSTASQLGGHAPVITPSDPSQNPVETSLEPLQNPVRTPLQPSLNPLRTPSEPPLPPLSPPLEPPSISYTRKINITAFEETNPIATSTVLVKRQVVLDVGGFDESFRGPEDMDLWMRIVKDNKAVLMDITLALYRERAGSLCMDNTRFLKEVLRVYDKAFAEGGVLYEKRFLKRRTVATRYTSAAWGLLNEGFRARALYYLFKSWIIYPKKIVHEMRYPHWRLKVLRKIMFNRRDTVT